MSWNRIMEIGRQLQSRANRSDDVAIGAELVAIAQSNISLALRLGIDPAPPENRMMSSGMEVFEGGLAETAIRDSDTGKVPVIVAGSATHSARESSDEAALPASEPPASEDAASQPSKRDKDIDLYTLLSSSLPSVDAAAAAVAESAALLPSTLPTPAAPSVPSVRAEPSEKEACRSLQSDEASDQTPQDTPEAVLAAIMGGPQATTPVASGTPATPEPAPVPAPAVTSAAEPPAPAATSGAEPSTAGCPASELPTAQCPGSSAESTPQQVAQEPSEDAVDTERVKGRGKHSKNSFGQFRNLYESRDGTLCVFEDEGGHVVAVNSSKLS